MSPSKVSLPIEMTKHPSGGWWATLGTLKAHGDTQAEARADLINQVLTLTSYETTPVVLPYKPDMPMLAYPSPTGMAYTPIHLGRVAEAGWEHWAEGQHPTGWTGSLPAAITDRHEIVKWLREYCNPGRENGGFCRKD